MNKTTFVSFFLLSTIFLAFINFTKNFPALPITKSENDSRLPYLTKDQFDNPVVCWTEKDSNDVTSFYFKVSKDQGSSFDEKIRIPVVPNIKVHNESMPKVAFGKDKIWAFYQTSEPGGHFSSGIRFTMSEDGGKNWSESKFITQDSSYGKSRSYFDIAALSNGEIGVVWLDHKVDKEAKGRPVFFAQTEGLVVGESIQIDKEACECCRTDITTDAAGNIHIAYRDLLEDGSRDMSYVKSIDGGKTFTTPVRISKDEWKVDGCPHSGPSIASDGKKSHAVWYTGKEGEKGVYYSMQKNDSEFINRSLVSKNRSSSHPQMCLIKESEPLLLWEESIETGDKIFKQIRYRTFGKKPGSIQTLSPSNITASYPVAISLKNGEALIAWHQVEQGKGRVYTRKVKP